MATPKNILFIMFDQLRFDYLSCSGHPHLHTPNIDWLAEQGVRFTNCYVQSPVCGASRMSFYTGRYVSSHGASWNGIPLKVGEQTMGDHLREAGMDAILVGKTHMKADAKGMARLGLAPDSIIGARVAECGFDIFTRDDGLWAIGPDGTYSPLESAYNKYLKDKGYDGDNPWHDYANSSIDEDGDIASGWLYKNANLPANIREEDSETPWLTRETIEFLKQKRLKIAGRGCVMYLISSRTGHILSLRPIMICMGRTVLFLWCVTLQSWKIRILSMRPLLQILLARHFIKMK